MRPFWKKQPKALRFVTGTAVLVVAVPLFCGVWVFDKNNQAHPKDIIADVREIYREFWTEPRG